MKKYESINVKPQTKKTIDRLAEKHQKSLVDFTEDMANYFDKTGVNPNDLQILSPAEELKKFRDTIISFLRKQEKDFILPVFSRVDTLAARFIQYIEEEAPRQKGGGGDLSLKGSLLKEMVKTDTPQKSAEDVSTLEAQYKKLKEEHESLTLKYTTLKKYFANVLDHTEQKTTTITPKPVIDLPMADINDYKVYLKRN